MNDDPLCEISGVCKPYEGSDPNRPSGCRYCGAEMHRVDGRWVRYDSPEWLAELESEEKFHE